MEILINQINNWEFELISSNDFIKSEFEFIEPHRVYNWYKKKFEYKNEISTLYLRKTEKGCIFRNGFKSYLLKHYQDLLSEDLIKFLNQKCEIPRLKLEGLREDQLEDLNVLLTEDKGIFQVFTGYGKTQIISTLAYSIITQLKESVLILTSSSTSLNEMKDRIFKLYGIRTSYFDYNSILNIINVKGFLRSHSYNKSNPYWKSLKWILVDEVEYSLTDISLDMIQNTEARKIYGFSATADKLKGERISDDIKLSNVIKRNRGLYGVFGNSLVFKKPSGFNIKLIDIRTSIFNSVKSISEDFNSGYSEIINSLFSDPTVSEGIAKVAYQESLIYIPMLRLTVIDYWLKNHFKRVGYTVINICGRGYELYVSGEYKCNITIDMLKRYVEDQMVDIIVGTSASYTALDLPKLNKVLPLTSTIAGNVIQYIGRVARSKKFEIFNLVPNLFIPCYSGDLYKRYKLISKYYENSNLIKITRRDKDYGIY